MMVAARVVTGILLLAHGFVHLLYLAPDVPEFSLGRSWLVPDAARRPFGLGLMAATVATFLLLALPSLGAAVLRRPTDLAIGNRSPIGQRDGLSTKTPQPR